MAPYYAYGNQTTPLYINGVPTSATNGTNHWSANYADMSQVRPTDEPVSAKSRDRSNLAQVRERELRREWRKRR